MLFVSKKVTHADFLAFIAAVEVKLLDIPMISFVAVPFECPSKDYPIVFFTSPRSAKFFLDRCQLDEQVEIATIGKSTSAYVEKRGYTVSFTGVKSGVPALVSEEFKVFVAGREVLFPQSNYSHRSMQERLVEHQITDLIVYKTALTPSKIIDQPKILVFTSPTNFEAFIQKNTINKDQHIIAWGKTTEAFIAKHNYHVNHTLQYSSFEELKVVLEQNYYTES
ncbi:hypothetical protein CW751_02680 [Brumimicrobium salinarum]|uniref:Uroporphyrinogen-III synthase n=1 Tax=Brumimicrobium salinarum TaxID=2058658 RepID=A0A2I0R6Q6_9FLAO|nr:uroporphyrinogen-III synthase [Brumimicrobium salinarum]PKR82254.1 hypothetical protein CW751_02680 [Brumimicrobium salinarum]